jgi:hypothetical protein
MAYKFSIDLTDEEYAAFNMIVIDADAWMENAVRNKVRKCLIYVADMVAQDDSLLDPADLAVIAQMINDEGVTLKAPRKWSDSIKHEIVKRTKLKTRKERDAEELEREKQQHGG